MMDKALMVLSYPAVILMGLLMLPYLLYLSQCNIADAMALKRQARCLDFDYRG